MHCHMDQSGIPDIVLARLQPKILCSVISKLFISNRSLKDSICLVDGEISEIARVQGFLHPRLGL